MCDQTRTIRGRGAAAFVGGGVSMVLLAVTFTSAALAQNLETPRGLRIGGPYFEPVALAPSASSTRVTVVASVAGAAVPPRMLFLEEVTPAGRPLGIVAELEDDGESGDAVPRDGRYSARLQLGSAAESERYFRVRESRADGAIVTAPEVFAVTALPIGFPVTNPADAVPTRPGYSDAVANTVSFTAAPGIGPARIREVVAEVGAELGTTIEILGYSPGLNGHVARFTGAGDFAAILRVAAALERRAEVDRASASYFGIPSAPTGQWWLPQTRVTALRAAAASSPEPVLGSTAVKVAVIELTVGAGFTCGAGTSLDGKCLPAPAAATCTPGTANNTHARKVGTLIAGADPGAAFDGVLGGVAPDARLLSLSAVTADDVGSQLQCAASEGAQIANMSLEFAFAAGTENANLRAGICEAVCGNVLMVASAGNHACPMAPPELPHPGFYATSMETCPCSSGTRNISDFMLSVGGTQYDDALGEPAGITLGDTCGPPDNMRSKTGDIYAPGWQVPGTDAPVANPGDFGTSWSAPIVAGCAAIIAAVDTWAGGATAWDPIATEARLRDSGQTIAALSGGKLLDCLAAVRRPYDVEFVLDRSGSMSAPTGASPTPTRWSVLTNAVASFATTMAVTAPTGSRMGVTLFSTAFPAMTSDPLAGMQPLTSGLASGLPGGVLNQVPGGGTPMGPGLQAGLAKLNASTGPRVVVLFTDGVQNVAPYVWDGCQFSDTAPNQLTSPPTPTNPAAITTPCPGTSGTAKIVAIGIGSPSVEYVTTLQQLATAHRGKLLIADDTASFSSFAGASCAGSIAAAFDCGIAPALYGSSLQTIESVVTRLVPDQSLLEFEVNADVTSLVIKLRAHQDDFDFGRFVDRLHVTKDGADVSAYFRKVGGGTPSSVLLATSFSPPAGSALPALTAEGSYTLRLLPNPDVDVLLTRLRDPISLLAFADEHRLDMDWELGPAIPRVGQPLRPRVTLRRAGEPITDAEVTARVFRPGDDLGDALARNPTTVDPTSGPDAASPGWQKYDQLWRTDPAFRAQLAASENLLPLVHRGDGVYDAPFDPGDVSGVYQIVYEVRAEASEFGVIQREGAHSAYVRFSAIDMDRSIVSRAVRGNDITLTLKPVGTNGRLLGPAQGSIFGVSGGAARIASVADHQDGTYTIVLSADPQATIDFNVLGETVYTGRADFEERRRAWWLVLLLLIVATLA